MNSYNTEKKAGDVGLAANLVVSFALLATKAVKMLHGWAVSSRTTCFARRLILALLFLLGRNLDLVYVIGKHVPLVRQVEERYPELDRPEVLHRVRTKPLLILLFLDGSTGSSLIQEKLSASPGMPPIT